MTRLVGTRTNPVLHISTGDDSVHDVDKVSGTNPIPTTEDTMVKILKELQILNLHLALLTDNMLDKDDIES